MSNRILIHNILMIWFTDETIHNWFEAGPHEALHTDLVTPWQVSPGCVKFCAIAEIECALMILTLLQRFPCPAIIGWPQACQDTLCLTHHPCVLTVSTVRRGSTLAICRSTNVTDSRTIVKS